MLIKSLGDCPPLTANDGCTLREWLHPRNDDVALPYSLAAAEVAVGERSYRHRLEQAEVYAILSGHGLVHVDDEAEPVAAGDAILVPARAVQWIENTGEAPLEFIVIVSPPWSAEGDERIDD